MTVNRTTLLDLPLPVTGTESGTWGDTTNNGLTQYVDIAIAGMSNLTSANFTAGALTIETTEGDSSATNISATSAQYAGFRVTSLAANSTITVGNTGTSPARSYRLINADATYNLTFKATGQTGVTLLPGQSALVAFNGTDYVIVGTVGAGSTTDNTVPRFDGTTGKILQSSGITIDDSNNVSGVAQLNITTLDATNIEVTNIKAKDGTAAASIADSTGVISVTANPVLSGGTANGVLYLNGSKVATSGSALVFDGTNLGIGTSSPGAKLEIYRTSSDRTTLTRLATINNASTNNPYTGFGTGLLFKGTDYSNTAQNFGAVDAVIDAFSSVSPPDTGFGAALTFSTGTNGSLTEKMRLTSSGNLGIGTSSPVGRLNVEQSADGFDKGIVLTRSGANYGTIFLNASNDTLNFGRSGSTSMTLTTSGNLGIGTSSPSGLATNYTTVDIRGSSGGAFRFGNATNSAYIYSDSNETNFATATAKPLLFGTNATERMRLDTSGNLGLGVTPSAWITYPALQISNASLWGAANNAYLGANYYFGSGSTRRYISNGYASEYSQVSGVHSWYTAPSGTAGNAITFTQAMTLDASGDLAIGTTTAPGARVRIKASNTTGSALYNYLNCTNEVDSDFQIRVTGSASTDKRAAIGTTTNTPLAFITNDTERARINSSGEFSLGTTSSSFTANVGIKLLSDGRMGCVVDDATTGTNSYHLYNTNATNNGYRFYVNVNGGINNYSANNVNLSDRREKMDFAPAGEYLSKICAIPVQTYKYIDQFDNEKTLGVVAQDVQAIAPELVSEDNWGTEDNPKMRLSIYQTDLQYALMKCIQEQQALITSLTARVALLEGN